MILNYSRLILHLATKNSILLQLQTAQQFDLKLQQLHEQQLHNGRCQPLNIYGIMLILNKNTKSRDYGKCIF